MSKKLLITDSIARLRESRRRQIAKGIALQSELRKFSQNVYGGYPNTIGIIIYNAKIVVIEKEEILSVSLRRFTPLQILSFLESQSLLKEVTSINIFWMCSIKIPKSKTGCTYKIKKSLHNFVDTIKQTYPEN
jgi:hypothetical protein